MRSGRRACGRAKRIIVTPQGSQIFTDQGKSVINMCANNYLGLADTPI